MKWRERLSQLVLAGGSLALSGGCFGGGCFACNASSDPCCLQPAGPVCAAEKACLAKDGGHWDYYAKACNPDMTPPSDLSVAVDIAHTVRDFSDPGDADVSDGSSED